MRYLVLTSHEYDWAMRSMYMRYVYDPKCGYLEYTEDPQWTKDRYGGGETSEQRTREQRMHRVWDFARPPPPPPPAI